MASSVGSNGSGFVFSVDKGEGSWWRSAEMDISTWREDNMASNVQYV